MSRHYFIKTKFKIVNDFSFGKYYTHYPQISYCFRLQNMKSPTNSDMGKHNKCLPLYLVITSDKNSRVVSLCSHCIEHICCCRTVANSVEMLLFEEEELTMYGRNEYIHLTHAV